MARTLTRMVFDAAGNLAMVVIPDDDAQLQDPAFKPAGTVAVDVSANFYSTCASELDLLVLAQPAVQVKDAKVAGFISQKIAVIQAAQSAAAAAVDDPVITP